MIASVAKEWFTPGDAYEISFGSGVDEIAAPAVVPVIDACIDVQRNRENFFVNYIKQIETIFEISRNGGGT